MTSFGPVGAFYDELMDNVPYRMWASYYMLLLAHQGVRPKSLLDVCCGTGTLCEMMQEEGYEVEGFDLSAQMIAVAREKAKHALKDIRYEVMDAATFDMGRTYDAAYSFFDSLNYITDPNRLKMAIHRVAHHLPPGGSFIFDLNTAYAFEAKMFDQKNLKRSSRVRYDWKGDWDPKSRLIHVHMKFWVDGEEIHETHVQRAYSDEQIRDLLAGAGFVDVKCFDSYTLDPARPKSDRVHYTSIKGGE